MSATIMDLADPSEVSQLLSSGQPITVEYQTDTSTLKAVETVHARNSYKRNFNSLQIGAQGVNLQIQNRDIVKLCTLHVKLNALPENVGVCRGWLLKAIRSLRVDFGGSEVLTMNQTQIWNALMNEGETSEKRMNILRVAGEKSDSSDGLTELSASLALPLPWSSMAYKNKEMTPGFDTRLVNSNLNVYINWNDPSCVFFGSGDYPTSFKSGYFKAQLDELYKQQDQVIRQSLLTNSLASYNYRFLTYQNYTASSNFTGSTSECSEDKVTLDLQSFRHGNLVSIILNLRKVSDIVGDANDIKNEMMYEKITNLEFSMNGVDWWELDQEGGDLENMAESYSGGSYVDYDYVVPGQVSAPYSSIPRRSYYSSAHLTALSQKAWAGIVCTGQDLGAQLVTVRFNTPDDSQYRLDCSYVYQIHAVVSNSVAKIKYTVA